MKYKISRSLSASALALTLLLSGCGSSLSENLPEVDSTRAAAGITVPDVTIPEVTVPEITVPDVTVSETVPDIDDSSVPGLHTKYLEDGTPIYAVLLNEYDAPGYNPINLMAISSSVDFYESEGQNTMACFFFLKPIRNCAVFNVPFSVTFADDKDNSDVGWRSAFVFGSIEQAILEDHSSYFVLDPEHVAFSEMLYSLNDNNHGLFDLFTLNPVDLCGVTAIPFVAPTGWSPFIISYDFNDAIVGFLTEEDRQVFLDQLSE